MIHGVGVDLVDRARFRRFARDHRRRLRGIFTRAERGNRRLAEAFSLKEATLKALGGLSGFEVRWREIETMGRGGRVRLAGSVRAHAETLGVRSVHGALVRQRDAVLAMVIAAA